MTDQDASTAIAERHMKLDERRLEHEVWKLDHEVRNRAMEFVMKLGGTSEATIAVIQAKVIEAYLREGK